MFNIKKYQENDYSIITSWNRKWNLPETPKSWIPEHSYFVEKDEKICIGFLYQLSNTPMYWIEGIITNPEISKDDRLQSLDILIKYLTNKARELNGEIVLSSSPRNGLINMFKDNNFNPAPEQYYHVGRKP